MASWFLSALEGLDDDHGSAAVGAGQSESGRLSVIVGSDLRRRHSKELAGAGDVADAPTVGEQPRNDGRTHPDRPPAQ